MRNFLAFPFVFFSVFLFSNACQSAVRKVDFYSQVENRISGLNLAIAGINQESPTYDTIVAYSNILFATASTELAYPVSPWCFLSFFNPTTIAQDIIITPLTTQTEVLVSTDTADFQSTSTYGTFTSVSSGIFANEQTALTFSVAAWSKVNISWLGNRIETHTCHADRIITANQTSICAGQIIVSDDTCCGEIVVSGSQIRFTATIEGDYTNSALRGQFQGMQIKPAQFYINNGVPF